MLLLPCPLKLNNSTKAVQCMHCDMLCAILGLDGTVFLSAYTGSQFSKIMCKCLHMP